MWCSCAIWYIVSCCTLSSQKNYNDDELHVLWNLKVHHDPEPQLHSYSPGIYFSVIFQFTCCSLDLFMTFLNIGELLLCHRYSHTHSDSQWRSLQYHCSLCHLWNNFVENSACLQYNTRYSVVLSSSHLPVWYYQFLIFYSANQFSFLTKPWFTLELVVLSLLSVPILRIQFVLKIQCFLHPVKLIMGFSVEILDTLHCF
jgi:hypothetical protein